MRTLQYGILCADREIGCRPSGPLSAIKINIPETCVRFRVRTYFQASFQVGLAKLKRIARCGVTALSYPDSSIKGERHHGQCWDKLHSQEKIMDAPTSAEPAEKSVEAETAEEICRSLEQSILKYFPSTKNSVVKLSSVPLVPRQQKAPI